jgi:hypothetical protein
MDPRQNFDVSLVEKLWRPKAGFRNLVQKGSPFHLLLSIVIFWSILIVLGGFQKIFREFRLDF